MGPSCINKVAGCKFDIACTATANTQRIDDSNFDFGSSCCYNDSSHFEYFIDIS